MASARNVRTTLYPTQHNNRSCVNCMCGCVNGCRACVSSRSLPHRWPHIGKRTHHKSFIQSDRFVSFAPPALSACRRFLHSKRYHRLCKEKKNTQTNQVFLVSGEDQDDDQKKKNIKRPPLNENTATKQIYLVRVYKIAHRSSSVRSTGSQLSFCV